MALLLEYFGRSWDSNPILTILSAGGTAFAIALGTYLARPAGAAICRACQRADRGLNLLARWAGARLKKATARLMKFARDFWNWWSGGGLA